MFPNRGFLQYSMFDGSSGEGNHMLHAIAFSLLLGAASAANEASLATKLAQAIASEHGVTSAKIYVGTLPPGKSISAPLPTGFTLLGSVVETRPRGGDDSSTTETTTAYYEVPANAQTALDAYKHRVAQAGWRESTFMRRFAWITQPKGGFAITPPRTATMPSGYCNGSNSTVLTVQRLRGTPDVVAISSAGGQVAAAFCAMAAMAKAMPSPPPSPPPLPTLNAAQGVTMQRNNDFAGLFENRSSARITTSLTPASVGQNFATQLTAAGWVADGPAQSATAYVQTFMKTVNGRQYQAVLTIVSAGKPQQYIATLNERDVNHESESPFDAGFSLPF
jgi:hypothetical protein